MTTGTSVFSLDQEAMDRLEMKFAERQVFAEARKHELFDVLHADVSEEETWALKYLYAYMPVNDLADYDGALFLSHVRRALAIRRRVPWGERVPDHLFLHFVLPYRVNTENIEDSRGILYHELAERTKHLSMADAILEVNYWCHEKATYIGSDLRTVSPLTMIRNARGRCGEESTLAVAALRSIGIPARQVYTPRWAHCDSNHAWVEAWADGTWYFIGACEPEASLNQGWFTPPARRAMLIDTRIFAEYPGPEEITYADKGYTEINLLDHYTRARSLQVKVLDSMGGPVADAVVRFELYNMAEFYPIASLKTDLAGSVSFKTGYGDLLIRAVAGDIWSEIKISGSATQDGECVELVLNISEQPRGTVDFDMVPPPEGMGEHGPIVTEEERQRHQRRLEEGTAIRTGYEGTFLGEEQAAKLARFAGLPPERVWHVLQKARGNSREIAAFLEERSAPYGAWPLRLLESLHDKDLIDTFRPALDDHLQGALAYRGDWPEELFVPYILCPRVQFEMIVPYRSLFRGAFTADEIARYRRDPAMLARELEHDFQIWDDVPNLRGKGNPVGTYNLKKGDAISLSILFVAVCRSLGIPSRLHPGEQKPQYWAEGSWVNAVFTLADSEVLGIGNYEPGRGQKLWGKLQLVKDSNAPSDTPAASYGENFSFARLENGAYKNLHYSYGSKNVYDEPYEVEPGDYRMTSGIRLKDGTVRVRFTYFTIREHETVEVCLTFREAKEDIPELGSMSRSHRLTLLDGNPADLEELIGAGDAMVSWIEPEREPTKHLLRELSELAEPLDQLGVPIILIIGDSEWATSFTPATLSKLPATTVFARDSDYSGLSELRSISDEAGAGFPYLMVLDRTNQIRYQSSGYKLGTGKEAVQILTGISKE